MFEQIFLILLTIVLIIGQCLNNEYIYGVKKIDVKNVNTYYLNQIDKDGAYLIYGCNNQRAIALFNSKCRISETKVKIIDDTLAVYYYTSNEVTNCTSLYNYLYLVDDSVNINSIDVYKNDSKSYFTSVIISDKRIAK